MDNEGKYCKYCAQAIRNEQFLTQIEEHSPNDFGDWKVTVIFYAAVHYLKSYANLKGIRLQDHQDTFDKLHSQGKGLSPELNIEYKARRAYMILFKLAHSTRYDGYKNNKIERKAEKLKVRDAKNYLKQFKDYIIPVLKEASIRLEAA